MKKVIHDRDMGLDCDYIATGNTDEEAIRNSITHLKDRHPDELHNQNLKEKAKENVREEVAAQ